MDRAKVHLANDEYDSATKELSRAIEVFQRNRWTILEILVFPRVLERITEVNNLEPWLLRDRARCYEVLGLPYRAIEDLSAFIDMDPRVRLEGYMDESNMESELLRILNRRAKLYLEIGDYELALIDYEACLNTDPGLRGVPLFSDDFRFLEFGALSSWQDLCEILCHVGEVYSALGKYDSAINMYSWAIHFGKGNPYLLDSHEGRAKAYEAKGELEMASKDSQVAARILWDVEEYLLSAEDYLIEGSYEMAISDSTAGIEIDPEEAQLYYVRGHALCSLGKFDLGIADYSKGISVDLKSLEVVKSDDKDAIMTGIAGSYLARGEAYFANGEYIRAVEDFRESLRLDPELEEARSSLMKALERTRKP